MHSGGETLSLVYKGQLVITQTLGFVFNKLLRAQKIFLLTLDLLEGRSDFGRKLFGSICLLLLRHPLEHTNVTHLIPSALPELRGRVQAVMVGIATVSKKEQLVSHR